MHAPAIPWAVGGRPTTTRYCGMLVRRSRAATRIRWPQGHVGPSPSHPTFPLVTILWRTASCCGASRPRWDRLSDLAPQGCTADAMKMRPNSDSLRPAGRLLPPASLQQAASGRGWRRAKWWESAGATELAHEHVQASSSAGSLRPAVCERRILESVATADEAQVSVLAFCR